MASIQKDNRTQIWFVIFRWLGKQYRRSCDSKSEADARAAKVRVGEMIRLLKQGHLELPEGADPGTWIMSGGKLSSRPQAGQTDRFNEVCEAYLEDQHGKAATTLTTEGIHIGHLKRIIGNTTLDKIDLKKVQAYVNRRVKEKHRGKVTSGITIKKELATFRQIWDWARVRQYADRDCPLYDGRKWAVRLPKLAEKEKFQTWSQIEKRIARGAGPQLWESLFLDETQVKSLLDHAKENARHQFIYPMITFCAYTGARRSEILRSEVGDFDFEAGQVRIREQKRKRDKSGSFRIVPIHNRLREVMKAWFAAHPGGQYTITADGERMTPHTAHHHFKHTFLGSKWEVVRGFHVLRHSFGSNLARSGIARETIGSWMGHSTQEMMDHYQHLFPQDGSQQINVLS